VRWSAYASLGPALPVDFCNETITTRGHTPRAPDPRPAMSARLFWSHDALRVYPRFPCDPFRGRAACGSPSLSRQAGSEPPNSIDAPPVGAASLPKDRTTKAAALRSAACGRHHEPLTGCADTGLKRRRRIAWVEPTGAKDLPLPRSATPHVEVAKGSPSPRLLEHPMVVGLRVCRGAGDSPRAHVSRPKAFT